MVVGVNPNRGGDAPTAIDDVDGRGRTQVVCARASSLRRGSGRGEPRAGRHPDRRPPRQTAGMSRPGRARLMRVLAAV